ncbi:MAG: hypothetical protein KDE27_07345 [Planctomycetes bacterium]|nr:hypothetical protein [Planctomycetota bacterium]
MIRPSLVLVPILVEALAGQAPLLDAAEVRAYRAAHCWLQELAGGSADGSTWAKGSERRFVGVDAAGAPGVGLVDGFARGRPMAVVYYPRRGSLLRERMLMANSYGEVFLGQRIAGTPPDWQPAPTTVAPESAPGESLALLRASGRAGDGTTWERVTALEADIRREQRVRFVRADGGSFEGFECCIGSSRYRWHPAWLPLEDGAALAFEGALQVAGDGEATVSGLAVPARGLRLEVRHGTRRAVLDAGDVRIEDGELVVTLPPSAMVEVERLDQQAWAVEALRQFAESELAARASAEFDRDGDGRGEFGEPAEVVPANRLDQLDHIDGLWHFQDHVFRLDLPRAPDDREQRFVAYAWPRGAVRRRDAGFGPAAPPGAGELAFAVDARGIVFACPAQALLANDGGQPLPDALSDAGLGWRALH